MVFPEDADVMISPTDPNMRTHTRVGTDTSLPSRSLQG